MSRISVFVRIRPQNQTEKRANMANMRVQADSQLREVRVFSENNERAKVFKFNKVFTPNYTQQEIFYEAEANKLVEKVLEGYHSTICNKTYDLVAYGQTGSGKTYSMEGLSYQLPQSTLKVNGSLEESNKSLGIIPRSLRHMFGMIGKDQQRTYQVSISFLQIYNEKIYDLLDCDNRDKLSNGLKLRWNKYQQFVVENLESLPCRSVQEALSIYLRGCKNKVMAKHKMNMNSSRSHTILTVKVQSYDNEDPKNILISKLELVDLAGSERQSVTGSIGKVFKEGIQINKSLFTLRQVISSLFEYNKSVKDQERQTEFHVPYRDSKLTSILKQSIGGNNYCVMIACLNPGDAYLEESVQTLTYASMASYISNVPTRNEDPKIKEIKMLREQLAEVTEQLHRANEHIKLLSELANKRIESGRAQLPVKEVQEQSQPSPKKYRQHQAPQQVQRQKIAKSNNIQLKARSSFMKPKQFIESLNMIKDLLQSNIILRENVEKLNKQIDKRDSQLYQVMKENQVLRDRWDMVGPMLAAQHTSDKIATNEDKKNISLYQKLLMEKNGGGRPISLRKNNASGQNILQQITPTTAKHHTGSGSIESYGRANLNLSYNELLKRHGTGKKHSSRKSRPSYYI